jgi:hypothetical protein
VASKLHLFQEQWRCLHTICLGQESRHPFFPKRSTAHQIPNMVNTLMFASLKLAAFEGQTSKSHHVTCQQAHPYCAGKCIAIVLPGNMIKGGEAASSASGSPVCSSSLAGSASSSGATGWTYSYSHTRIDIENVN